MFDEGYGHERIQDGIMRAAEEELAYKLTQVYGAYRRRKDEYIFRVCPQCGNERWNFEINVSKQLYSCWVCSSGGSLTRLLRYNGIDYDITSLPAADRKGSGARHGSVVSAELRLPEGVEPVLISKGKVPALEYLRARRLDEDDVERYEMLWWPKEYRILFPLRDFAGGLIFWTARTILPRGYPKYIHAEVPKNNLLLILRGINEDKPLLLVEGIFDAIRAHKEGYTVIILMGSSISPTVKDYLRHTGREVTLCLDHDMAHKQPWMERDLARAVGRDKVTAKYLPEKDIGEIGVQGLDGLAGFVRSRVR